MREQSSNSDTNTATPHFDDERTLLTARRVIPLERIDARVVRKRRWFLGGAFAIAMLLGAASALLASYVRLRNAEAPASEITQVELTPAPLPIEENVTEQPPTVAGFEEIENSEEAEAHAVSEAPKRHTPPKRRTAPRPESDYILPSRDTSGMSEEDELERIRAAVLYNEWQERRLRRVNRRERRRAERANRDLSNLDEIFEGPRRP